MTTKAFDPYRDWLGVTDANRPLNHYQLLRLKQFEDDSAKIRHGYHQLSAHVRKQLSGKAADEANHLLGELTKAMLCLTDSHRKSEYDVSLGRTTSVETRNRSFDEILLSRKIIDAAALEKAKKFTAATGIELYDAIVQQKMAPTESVTQARAESMGVPFLDLGEFEPEAELIAKLPAVLARQHSCVPLMVEHGQLVLASPNPLSHTVEDEVRLRTGLPVRLVLCTPVRIHEFINKHYTREMAAQQMGVTSKAATAAAAAAGKGADGSTPEERRKKRQQMALICGMFPAMIIVLVGTNFLSLSAFIIWPLAAVVGGIGAFVGSKMA